MDGELIKKICELINGIGFIPKTGVNTFHNYEYRKHEDIMAKLSSSLTKCGLVIYPKSKKLLSHTHEGKSNHVIIETVFTITDGKNSFDFMGLGEGIDNGDKAIYKAQTGATKYALNDLLMLASEMDAEAHDTHKTSNNTTPQKLQTGIMPATSKIDLSDQDQIIDLCAKLEIKPDIRLKKADAIGAAKVIEELTNMSKGKEQ